LFLEEKLRVKGKDYIMTDKIDVIIIGAGIAGITTAYYLQKNFPDIKYKIIDSRSAVGGTWDQMRFPGVRADNDMYTYGFSFNPWQGPIIGKGQDIKNYINDTAEKFNIKKNILFDTKVISSSWKINQWTTKTNHKNFTSQYVIFCTGSRDRDKPHLPKFKDENKYQGKIVHTQNWGDTDYKDKNVTIIGSGCTAITMAPSIIKEAKAVTLVQRSPAWIINIDSHEKSSRRYKTFEVLKDYISSRFFKKSLRKRIIAADPYYNEATTPSYDYWDQRPASSLDQDYFRAVESSNVTIERVGVSNWETRGIKLQNGKVINSDVTVMATGGNAQLLGGIDIFVNDKKININDTSWYRGMMFSGLPNLFAHAGYINFSWTARCEIVNERICKTIKYMKENELSSCTAKYLGEKSKPSIQANYVLRAMDKFPNRTYKFYQNYFVEYLIFKWSKINDGALDFKR
jgi:cation diffusion facilitator CzcD-associated flavoprotein CzcO|tara:strand:+ start:1747 stop:3120 length:1374 start_codon:yes stop_codon:yes gene_type:complete